MNFYIKRLFSPLISIKTTLKRHAMPPARRHRAFVFTWNNYDDASEALLSELECRYVTYGREVGENGTPHLQGFVYFTSAKTHAAVRNLLTGCHVEVARAIGAAIEYCQKDGDFIERGDRPSTPAERGQAEIQRWETSWTASKEGRIEEVPADIRLRCYASIKRVEKDYMARPLRLESVCGIWIYGPSGVGKTHAVFESYPSLYSKNSSKWWDGYQGEETILFDDADTTHKDWAGRFFKIWADKYPFIADNKGGSIHIRPKRFVVTSQYTIEQIFPDVETREALRRRFTIIEKLTYDTPINLG